MEEHNDLQNQSQQGAESNAYLVPGSIVVAGALVAFAIFYSNASLKGVPAKQENAESNALASLMDAGTNVLGNPDAPVTIVEFGDFQCPFCAMFHREVLPLIFDKYVKTGKAKFAYRDFPLSNIHPYAQKSAEASRCAGDQGKFWQYHDLLYGRQNEINMANLKVWALELELDLNEFNSCLDSGKHADQVQKDFNDGLAAGVSGTPATFVNGRLVSGAVPFSQFEQIIEEELAKAR